MYHGSSAAKVQISERSDNSRSESRGFETLRFYNKTSYWISKQGPGLFHHCLTAFCSPICKSSHKMTRKIVGTRFRFFGMGYKIKRIQVSSTKILMPSCTLKFPSIMIYLHDVHFQEICTWALNLVYSLGPAP